VTAQAIGVARRFLRWMALCDASPEVVVAQVREVARHIPALYVVIAATVMMFVYVASDAAPWWLTLGLPTLVWALVIARVVRWNEIRYRPDLTPGAALALLRGTLVLTFLLSIADLAWAMTVLRYVGTDHTPMVMIVVVSTANSMYDTLIGMMR
jgi:predicted signal transduction protein with EAL and GGDEF domain